MIADYLSPHRGRSSEHTELRAQVNINHSVSFLSGTLVTNSQLETAGVSARVYRNGVYGFASNAEYSADSVGAVLRAATDNAEFMDRHIGKGKPSILQHASGVRPLTVTPKDEVQSRLIDAGRIVDDYIAKTYPGLLSRMIAVRTDSMEKLISVTGGYDAHTFMPRSFIYVFLTAADKDGIPVEIFEPYGASGLFEENFPDPAAIFPDIDRLYEELMKKREGIYADAGMKTCVLHQDLAGMLAHEAVGHTVEGDLVLGGSVASTHLGKQVASEKITMVDFANEALGSPAPLPLYVDDEGTVCKDELLIDKGMLTGYMNSRETALHFGMEPKGNARAYLFSDEPLIRMRNTAILPGTDKLADMIASVDDGYYLTKTNNGQADTTGEFMFGIAMGYEIKNGKLGRAIRDTTISGVAFDMLKTVDMVSDEMSWTCSGMCGKKQPMPVGMGGPALRCRVNIGGR